jgi:hypothetical protein
MTGEIFVKTRSERAICILAAAFVFILAREADAAVEVAVKNNRSYSISLTFCWAGLDYEYDVSKGWYNVKAGETRTITLKDAAYALTSQNFGYYAKGTPKGGKTVYWKGEGGDEYMEFYIHPKNSFTGNHDDPIEGGQKVSFRKIALKETGDSREDGTAALTFNP